MLSAAEIRSVEPETSPGSRRLGRSGLGAGSEAAGAPKKTLCRKSAVLASVFLQSSCIYGRARRSDGAGRGRTRRLCTWSAKDASEGRPQLTSPPPRRGGSRARGDGLETVWLLASGTEITSPSWGAYQSSYFCDGKESPRIRNCYAW